MTMSAGILDDLASRVLEYPNEQPADDLSLVLRISDPFELIEKTISRINNLELDARSRYVIGLNLLALALAQQAVVDEHAREVVANRSVDQRCCNRRIDTTR